MVEVTTIRILNSLDTSNNWRIKPLDVSNGFLHGNLKELIYMDQPLGLQDNRFPQHVCQFQRSLYGLKQAPGEWFLKLTNFLLSPGFSDSKTDPSIFFKYHGNTPYFFLIYVDDILVISHDSTRIQDIVRLLAKVFSMKDLGQAHFFLKIELLYSLVGCFLSQSHYTLSILCCAKIENIKRFSNSYCSSISSLFAENFSNATLYCSIVGALQYLVITRLKITYAVNRACQAMQHPTIEDWCRAKHLLRYLKGTIDKNLFYHRNYDSSLELFSDADWASSLDNRRSNGGYLIYVGKNLISWSTCKQRRVARSSTNAEYITVVDATSEFICIRSLFYELLRHFATPILGCDNLGATYLAANPIFHARKKHMEIDYHFVREQVKSRHLWIGHLSTKEQTADILTKALPKQRFLML